MSDYHFEDENDLSKETIRLDHVNQQVKNYKKEQTETQENTLTEPSAIRGIENAAREMRANLKLNQEIRETTKKKQKKRNEAGLPKAVPDQKRNGYMVGVLLAVVGIAIFILCFFLFFSKNQIEEKPQMPDEPIQEIPDTIPEERPKITALVQTNMVGKELELYDIKSQTYLTLETDAETKATNEAGEPLNLSAIKMGDILEIQTDAKKVLAREIAVSKEVWTLSGATGFIVDEGAKQISFSGKDYRYGEETIFLYHDTGISVKDLETIDIATVKGYQDDIYSIKVDKFHGYLVVKNSAQIQEGMMQIDEEPSFSLQDSKEIPIVEGSHKITISGANIETYKADIYITANEKFEINTQPKTGVLILKANITEYKLFINGAQIADPMEPLVLDLGEYTIRVEKEGYEPWEQSIVLTEPSKEVTVTLTPKTTAGSLSITTSPDGAFVYIDGVYVGVSPLETQVVFGEHRILVKKEGYIDVDSPITFHEDNQVYSVMLTQE